MKFFCTNCGAEFLKWEGKCSACGTWDSLSEVIEDKSSKKSSVAAKALTLKSLGKDTGRQERFSSTYNEFDRVLGGGIVKGSVILIAGEPGIGKSTLLLQVVLNLSMNNKVLYVSGEESISQLVSRIKRVGGKYDESNLLITESTNASSIIELVRKEQPALLVIDSIQSMESDLVKSSAGSIGQVRICGSLFTRAAKELGIPTFIVGQINKDGNIAGPKVLEHVVDVVIYFEGGEYNAFRLLRSVKNRYGSTNEIGVFEMGGKGFLEVDNPSKVFIDSVGAGPGSAVGAIVKGTRVVFVEVQALVVERSMEGGPLRRVANGIKKQRLDMLCAVLTKRGGAYLNDKDVFVNVVGGLNVDDPALDLSVCAAIKAAITDKVLDRSVMYYGEVGLTGEVRSGWAVESVIKEAKRVGYKGACVGAGVNLKVSTFGIKVLEKISKA